jgi:hypothetical protein
LRDLADGQLWKSHITIADLQYEFPACGNGAITCCTQEQQNLVSFGVDGGPRDLKAHLVPAEPTSIVKHKRGTLKLKKKLHELRLRPWILGGFWQ